MLAAADRLLVLTPAGRTRASSPSLSHRLRAGTRQDHAAAEASLDMTSLQQAVDLARMLCAWRSVWRDVAQAASAPRASAAARSELLPMARQAERWLQADLRSLGSDAEPSDDADAGGSGPPDVELCALLADPVSSWGVAYVLRGSRLGGTVLAPQVKAALELSGPTGTAFLASTGTEPGREMVAFRHRLDDVDLTADQLVEVVDAARWTFGWVARVFADHAVRYATTNALLPPGGAPGSRHP